MKIYLYLFLAASIFLLAPTNKAKAQVVNDFCCHKYEFRKNITAEYESAITECNAFCETPEGCSVEGDLCPIQQFSCVKNGKCSNKGAIDIVQAGEKCQGGIPLLGPCPSPTPSDDSLSGCGGNALGSAKDLQCQAQLSLNKANFSSPEDLISRAIKILMAFIGSISLVLYIWSGFLWMTASGNAEQVSKAQTTMVWTSLGVGIMLASYMLVSFLFKSLGL